MNLLNIIVWFINGIFWTHITISNPLNIWNWLIAAISFAACFWFAKRFDEQLKAKK